MKKIFLSILFAGTLFPVLASGQTSVRSLNGSTPQFNNETGSSNVQYSNNSGTTVKEFEPKPWGMSMFVGYSGANSRYGSSSSDLVSGFSFGFDFTFGKKFLFNLGASNGLYFQEKSNSMMLNFPVRVGLQHGWEKSDTKDAYIRILTGPIFCVNDLGETNKFNCEWDVRLEYEVGMFRLYLSTAWGIHNMGTSDYKMYVNTPISVGIALALR